MSVLPPRRIFRSGRRAANARRRRVRPALMVGLIGGTLGVALIMLGLPATLFGRVPPVTGIVQASPEQVAVVDGETLLVHEMVVRLQGIAAPARGSQCQGVDGGTRDCGAASAEALARLVRGRDVRCQLNGRDSEGLAQGLCEASGTELNRAQVSQGWARARGTSVSFAPEEASARDAARGLGRSGAF